MDKFSEVRLILELSGKGDQLLAMVFAGTVALAVLVNAVLLYQFVYRVLLKSSEVSAADIVITAYFQDRRSAVAVVFALALLRFDLLQLLCSRLQCCPQYTSAPLSPRIRDKMVVWGTAGTVIEDIPQFLILLISFEELRKSSFGVVTTVLTVVSILISALTRCIAYVTAVRSKQQLNATKATIEEDRAGFDDDNLINTVRREEELAVAAALVDPFLKLETSTERIREIARAVDPTATLILQGKRYEGGAGYLEYRSDCLQENTLGTPMVASARHLGEREVELHWVLDVLDEYAEGTAIGVAGGSVGTMQRMASTRVSTSVFRFNSQMRVVRIVTLSQDFGAEGQIERV